VQNPKRLLRVLFAGLVLGVAVVYVALNARNQWDFNIYYSAATAFRGGLDPYNPVVLAELAGMPVNLPYLYPPISLLLFVPFSYLPIELACLVWLGIKCLLAVILLRIWWLKFLPRVPPDIFLVTALLAFDLALLWDMRSGNVALIEEALLWFGLLAYIRGRFVAAAVLIALGSVFKLYPIALLLLLLVPPPIGRVRAIATVAGFALFCALVAAPLVPLASWVHALVHELARERLTADISPGALGLFDWTLARQPWSTAWVAPGLFVLYGVLFLVLSRGALYEAYRSASRLDMVITATLAGFLLSPRVMIYTYASAVVPVLFVFHTKIRSRKLRVAATILLIAPGIIRLIPGKALPGTGAASFAFVLLAWALWAHRAGPPPLPVLEHRAK